MNKLCLIILLGLSVVSLIAQISSTTFGGNWSNASTWIGGVVPNENNSVIIQGPVSINTTNSCYNLSITSAGSIINSVDDVGQVTVYGNVTNHGQVRDDGSFWGETRLVVLGNISNHNIMTCEYVYYAGETAHSFSNSGTFNPVHFLNMSAAPVSFLSDLSMTGTHVYLPYMYMNAAGNHISLSGGFIEYSNIIGGNSATLNLSNGAYLNYVTADEIVLQGTVLLGEGIMIYRLINYANIYNRSSSSCWFYIYESLQNYGLVANNPEGSYLYLDLRGDLLNHQSLNPQQLNLGFNSSGTKLIASDTVISVPLITAYADYQMLSDMSFSGCAVDFTSHNLLMQDGDTSHSLSLDEGYLVGVNLDGGPSSALSMANNAYLSGVTADEIIVSGTVLVSDNVSLGSVINYGDLRNVNDNPHVLVITQRLENHGTITNASSTNFLNVNLFGDLVNYGHISNHQFMLYGNTEQYVLRAAGSVINCAGGFQLVSDVGYAQWYFSGSLPDPEYTDHKTINPAISGVWSPFNGSSYGRDIIIASATGTPQTPQNVSAVFNGPSLRLQWNQVPDAVYYTIYAASSPNGTYTAIRPKAFDSNLMDGVVWQELSASEGYRFFRISAAY